MEGVILELNAHPLRCRIVDQKEPSKRVLQLLFDVMSKQREGIDTKLLVSLQTDGLAVGIKLFAEVFVKCATHYLKVGNRASDRDSGLGQINARLNHLGGLTTY